MGERIIQPPFYNSGFYNTGSGGGDWFNYGELELGGKKYKTLQIGSLIWLCENLVFLPNEIQLGLDGTPTTPAAWFYNNDVSNSERGLLYNWYSLSVINTYLSDGWRVAKRTDWTKLKQEIGYSQYIAKYLRGKDYSGGTDNFGFCAVPCGSRYNVSFYSFDTEINLWTSDAYDSAQAYFQKIGVSDNSLYQENWFQKHLGYSVRLCKDV